MSDIFASILSDLTASSGDGELVPGTLGEIVRAGLNEGVSGSAMYNATKGTSLGIRRQKFFQLVANERAKLASGEELFTGPLNELPGRESITQLAEGRAGTFRTNIRVTYSTNIGDNETAIEERYYSISSSELISPSDAMDAVSDIHAQHAARYGTQILGLEYTGTIENLGS